MIAHRLSHHPSRSGHRQVIAGDACSAREEARRGDVAPPPSDPRSERSSARGFRARSGSHPEDVHGSSQVWVRPHANTPLIERRLEVWLAVAFVVRGSSSGNRNRKELED